VGTLNFDSFNFDTNSAINASDYNQFRTRFGKSLSYTS